MSNIPEFWDEPETGATEGNIIAEFEPSDWSEPNISKYKGKGLLEDYMKAMSNMDSPEIFKLLTFFHTLSWTIGRFFKWEHKRLNLMVILSSRPGVTHRSTLLNIDYEMRKTAYMRYLPLVKKSQKDKNLDRDWDEGNIMSGTPQGIADAIPNLDGIGSYKKPYLLSIQDGEFGQTLKSENTKIDFLTLLTRLKDGDRYRFELTSKDPRVIAQGTYATLLGSCQEPDMYLNVNHVRQGLMRRILLCYVPNERLEYKNRVSFSKFGKSITKITKDTNKIGERLGDRMVKYKQMYNKNGLIPIDLSEGALKILDRVEQQSFENEKQFHDLISMSSLSDVDHLLMLSSLVALCNDSIKNGSLYVLDTDVTFAWDILNELQEQRSQICWEIGLVDEENKHLRYSEGVKIYIDNVWSYILRRPQGKLTDIQKQFYLPENDFVDVLKFLKKTTKLNIDKSADWYKFSDSKRKH